MSDSSARPRLRRQRQGRVLGGVCAGLASRWGWRVSLVRVLFLVATLIPVLPGLPLYLILWLLVPLEDGTTTEREPASRSRTLR